MPTAPPVPSLSGAVVTGSYYLGASTGILPVIGTLGAGAEIFQFRWFNSSKIAVVRKVAVTASVTTTMFAAGVPVEIDLMRASGWSVAGTGGTPLDLSTDCRADTGLSASGATAGDIRMSTTAALGAGTKTLETRSISNLVAGGPITAILQGTIMDERWMIDADVASGDVGLVLRSSEGFVIRCVNAPATGTWRFSVRINWTEMLA